MPRKQRRQRTRTRIAELADANSLMRECELSDDASQCLALLIFLRDNARARFWLGSLISEEQLPDWIEACKAENFTSLKSLGVSKKVIRELSACRNTERDEGRIYGGLTEADVRLLLRNYRNRQSRVGLKNHLILRLWRRFGADDRAPAIPGALGRATVAMVAEAFQDAQLDGGPASERVRRLSRAIKQLEKPRDTSPANSPEVKRPIEKEWRLPMLEYMLSNPKPRYTVTELTQAASATPIGEVPRERKDVINFCRSFGIAASDAPVFIRREG